jgi:LysR family transcriptional activator of nhaA
VPKFIAHRLLAPVLALPGAVRLICHEDRLDRLLADLAIHRLDMVLADRPMPSGTEIKGYSHPLGETGVAFMAAPALAARLTVGFPDCLDAVPLLLPGRDSALHASLPRWLERQGKRVHIVGEFDDSALMKAFGEAGAGVFPAPIATVPDVTAHYQVVSLGETKELRERFFLISAERRLSHPAARAVSEHARGGLFAPVPRPV